MLTNWEVLRIRKGGTLGTQFILSMRRRIAGRSYTVTARRIVPAYKGRFSIDVLDRVISELRDEVRENFKPYGRR